MGTRVDFYVGRGESAEWLGSYPFDGYPDGVFDGENEAILAGPTEEQWRGWVENWLAAPEQSDRATLPEHGWPWPWETSALTDSYAWDDGVIYGSSCGHAWFKVDPSAENYGEPEEDEAGKVAVFPDMSDRKAVTYGPRSGLIVLGGS